MDSTQAFGANLQGFPCIVDQIEKYHLITLKASFNYKPSALNPNEHQVATAELNVDCQRHTLCTLKLIKKRQLSRWESGEFNIFLNEWMFGREAQITLG